MLVAHIRHNRFLSHLRAIFRALATGCVTLLSVWDVDSVSVSVVLRKLRAGM